MDYAIRRLDRRPAELARLHHLPAHQETEVGCRPERPALAHPRQDGQHERQLEREAEGQKEEAYDYMKKAVRQQRAVAETLVH